MKDIRIVARVTEREKEKISSLAKKCGLSQSEYIKQRALGFEPRAILPEAFFFFSERIDALADMNISPEVTTAALKVLKEIEQQLIYPGREDMKAWQPPDSGP